MIIEMNKIFKNMKIFLRFDFASLLDNRQPNLCQQSARQSMFRPIRIHPRADQSFHFSPHNWKKSCYGSCLVMIQTLQIPFCTQKSRGTNSQQQSTRSKKGVSSQDLSTFWFLRHSSCAFFARGWQYCETRVLFRGHVTLFY